MLHSRGGRRLAIWTVSILLVGTISLMSSLLVSDLNGQQGSTPKKGAAKPDAAKPDAAAKPDLMADIDDAIKSIEKNDLLRFLELYAPVEILRNIRNGNQVAAAVQHLSTQPKFNAQVLELLKAIRKEEPIYDDSKGLAKFRYDPTGDGTKEFPGELHPPVTEGLKLTGLGSDVKKVVADAEKLLTKGDLKTFVERIFPASQLAQLQEPGAMEDLISQMKAVPELPKSGRRGVPPKGKAGPTIEQTMQADFKKLQSIKPELTEKGTVAVFTIPEENDRPEREISFQKVGNDWRLFDDAKRIHDELARLSQLKPTNAIIEIQMELVGGNWRFVALPIQGGE